MDKFAKLVFNICLAFRKNKVLLVGELNMTTLVMMIIQVGNAVLKIAFRKKIKQLARLHK